MRAAIVSGVAEGFAQIAAQNSSLWFQYGRYLQILPPGLRVAVPELAQAAPEPGVAQTSIQGHGVFKRTLSFTHLALGKQYEPLDRQRLGIARGEPQALFQRRLRRGQAAEP